MAISGSAILMDGAEAFYAALYLACSVGGFLAFYLGSAAAELFS